MLYPIGIQNFENIRRGGFVYVDKTALIEEVTGTMLIARMTRDIRTGKPESFV